MDPGKARRSVSGGAYTLYLQTVTLGAPYAMIVSPC